MKNDVGVKQDVAHPRAVLADFAAGRGPEEAPSGNGLSSTTSHKSDVSKFTISSRISIFPAQLPRVDLNFRSIGGGLHALNFDAPAGDYYNKANNEILVVLQSECAKWSRQFSSSWLRVCLL